MANLEVDVVAPAGPVWQGEAVMVIARTTEGDIGILPGHEPVIAALAAYGAQVVTTDGHREVIAVGGGFISVMANHVALLSDSAVMAKDYSLDEARRELAQLKDRTEARDLSDDEAMHLHLLEAQVAAGEKYAAMTAR